MAWDLLQAEHVACLGACRNVTVDIQVDAHPPFDGWAIGLEPLPAPVVDAFFQADLFGNLSPLHWHLTLAGRFPAPDRSAKGPSGVSPILPERRVPI